MSTLFAVAATPKCWHRQGLSGFGRQPATECPQLLEDVQARSAQFWLQLGLADWLVMLSEHDVFVPLQPLVGCRQHCQCPCASHGTACFWNSEVLLALLHVTCCGSVSVLLYIQCAQRLRSGSVKAGCQLGWLVRDSSWVQLCVDGIMWVLDVPAMPSCEQCLQCQCSNEKPRLNTVRF